MSEDEPNPATTGKKRKTRDRTAVALALAAGRTIKDAAAAGHVSERSVRGWLADEAFTAQVRELRREILAAAVGRLVGLTAAAADTLRDHLSVGRPGDRIRAATAIIDRAVRGAELLDLMDRVAELEARVAAGAAGKGGGW